MLSGAKESVGQRSAAASIPIAETFASIQGEGGLTGMPSFFIRVSGCNLRCAWCDTPYASWKPEGDARTIESLVGEAARSGLRHVVLTGGEPMMFPQIAPLAARLRECPGHRFHVTVETAGTINQPLDCDLMSISPKLSNSTPATGDGSWSERHERRRINLPSLQALINRHSQRQLKFVVTRREDVVEIDDLLSRLSGWTKDDVMLMPEGVVPPTTERSAMVAELCMERGWRYCRRLHIDLFGNRRGT